MLLELGLLSFDTLLYNSRMRFGNQVQRTNNIIIAQLRLIFTTRCYASAVLATALCLSVCLSVCRPSQAGVLLKRQNIRSHKQHHTIPQGL